MFGKHQEGQCGWSKRHQVANELGGAGATSCSGSSSWYTGESPWRLGKRFLTQPELRNTGRRPLDHFKDFGFYSEMGNHRKL